MNHIKRPAVFLSAFFVLGVVSLIGVSVVQAGPWLSKVTSWEQSCTSTASKIAPDAWPGQALHSFSCYMNSESRDGGPADDSATCVCVGGTDVNTTTKCHDIGGCATANASGISVDGTAMYCLSKSGTTVTMDCVAGRGQP